MKRFWRKCVPFVALVGLGCSDGTITEEDTHQMQREFSGSNYEREMKRLGRTKELEEEKTRAQAHRDDDLEPATKPTRTADERSERE